MRQTLKSLPLSFYSAPFYQQLIANWKGIGLGFLLIATLLNVAYIATNIPFSSLMEDNKAFFERLPAITLENGVLSMEGPSPQEITIFNEAKDGPYKIVFDTSAPEKDLSALMEKMRNEKTVIYVTSKNLLLNNLTKNESDIKTFEGIEDVTMTHEDWVKMGDNVSSYLAPSMIFPLFGIILIRHLSTAFAGAVFLLLLSSLFKIKSEIKGMMRLAAAAKIPVAVLALFVTPHMALQGLIWFGFAAFGLLSTRHITSKPSEIL